MIKPEVSVSTNIDNIGKAISHDFLINDGYNTARTGRCVTEDGADEFIKALQVAGYDAYDLREFDGSITAFSEDKSVYVYVSMHRDYTDIYTKKGELSSLVSFFQQFKDYFEYRNPDNIDITYFYHDLFYGSTSRNIVLPKERIQHTIPELYPDYDVEQLSAQFLASQDNILLLYGQPGVGKTQFLRYIMKHTEFENIIYVKDSSVLNGSEFWVSMAEYECDLLIFDDMDDILRPRKIPQSPLEGESEEEFEERKKAAMHSLDNQTFMRNILSFTDGIFEKKTKVIITTNQEIEEVDSAIVRPGRCFDFLTLNPLSYEEAAVVWKDILKNDLTLFIDKFSGQKTVTQAALMSENELLKNAFTERTYVKRGNRNYSIESKIRDAGVVIR